MFKLKPKRDIVSVNHCVVLKKCVVFCKEKRLINKNLAINLNNAVEFLITT